jgi:hypothetical protein
MLARGITVFTLPTAAPLAVNALPDAAAQNTPARLPIAKYAEIYIEIVADTPGTITLAATSTDPLLVAYYNALDEAWGAPFDTLATSALSFVNRIPFRLNAARGGLVTAVHLVCPIAFSAAVSAYAYPIVSDGVVFP